MYDNVIVKTAGTGAPFLAFAISHATVNSWLQTISLTIGITVGIFTLIGIIQKKLKK